MVFQISERQLEILEVQIVAAPIPANLVGTKQKPARANRVGHAVMRDPKLEKSEILTKEAPMLGISDRAPDGVENLMAFRTGSQWTLIYSEGLAEQHLAMATSDDLRTWKFEDPLEIGRQKWMARKYVAPFVWQDGLQWMMILRGEDAQGRTTFGLLISPDGMQWRLLPEFR